MICNLYIHFMHVNASWSICELSRGATCRATPSWNSWIGSSLLPTGPYTTLIQKYSLWQRSLRTISLVELQSAPKSPEVQSSGLRIFGQNKSLSLTRFRAVGTVQENLATQQGTYHLSLRNSEQIWSHGASICPIWVFWLRIATQSSVS
jgi:hypothetical protein